MTDINGKDAALGILIIVVIGVAGYAGFLAIKPPPECPECDECSSPTETIYLQGLPDDWGTAPNSSSIILYNTTEVVQINLKQILDAVRTYLDSPSGHENEWLKKLELYTVKDKQSGLWVTGVDILEVLAFFDTNFAGDLNFISHADGFGQREILNTSAYDLTSKMYEGDEEPVILAISANKSWLAESPIGDICGNFSIFGKNMGGSCKNLEYINVLNNWTVEVYVNGVLNLTLSPYNLTTSKVTVQDYAYVDTGWYNYNRTYWGVNISDIIAYTGADIYDFSVRFKASDGFQHPKGAKPAYNKTDVMNHLSNNGTNIVGNHVDYVNGTTKNDYDNGVPMAATNLRMCLIFADRELGEGLYPNYDPVWPYRRYCRYSGGPYQVIIPGRIKGRYLEHVSQILITY